MTYRAVVAQQRATRLAHVPRRPRKLNQAPRLRQEVFALLAQCWSPEQIAQELALRYPTDPTMRLAAETLYTYLYVLPRGQLKRQVIAALRQRHQPRRSRRTRRRSRAPVQDLVSIEERPTEVADRTVPGH